MKKIFLSVAVITALVLGLQSCSKEEKSVVEMDDNSKSEMIKLADQLQSLNESTLAEYGQSIDFVTRGFDFNVETGPDFYKPEAAKMKWWKRLLCVITADAVGGACGTAFGGPVGGVALGVGASASMWIATRSVIRNDNNFKVAMSTMQNNMNNYMSEYDRIGDCHNIIMTKLENNSSRFINPDGSENTDALISLILQYTREAGYNTSSLSTFTLKRELNKISSARLTDENATFEEQIANYVKFYPEKKESLTILKSYINTASSLPNVNAIKAYSVNFEKTVLNANISVSDKAMLLSGESIGKNSTVGWTVTSK